jgi:hypothetical protein
VANSTRPAKAGVLPLFGLIAAKDGGVINALGGLFGLPKSPTLTIHKDVDCERNAAWMPLYPRQARKGLVEFA